MSTLTINYTGCPLPSQQTTYAQDIPQSAIREIFGALWFRKGTAPDANVSDQDYLQCLSLKERYSKESNELLSNLISSSLLNARNLWMISVMMPIFETTAQRWHMKHTEWNNTPYTPKAEGGTDNQITYSEWMTEDSMGPIYSQSTEIEVRVSRDNRYGFETWWNHMNQLNKNLSLTLMLHAIRDVRNVAFRQMVMDAEKKFCAEQLFGREGRKTFIATKPEAFFDEINSIALKQPGDLLLIIPPLGERFLRNFFAMRGAKPRQLTAKEIYYNPNEKRLRARNHPGPMSAYSMPIGMGDHLDCVISQMFLVNKDDPAPHNPLATTMSNCQIFGLNPYTVGEMRATKIFPHQHDLYISNQSMGRCIIECVDRVKQLRGCWLWDESGAISQYCLRFIRELNSRKAVEGAPWQFRPGSGSQDVNDDRGSYAVPPEDAKNFTGDLLRLKSWREMPGGPCMWDPRESMYREVQRVGDYNLCVLGHHHLTYPVQVMRLAFIEQTGINPAALKARIKSWYDNCRNAPVTATYIKELINAQMPALLRDGAYTYNGLKEFPPNNNGSLILPLNDNNALTGMKWANGFHSGPGLLTAAEYQLEQGAAFYDMCQAAGEVLKDVRLHIDFLRRNVGNTDVINPMYGDTWFLEKNAEATYISSMFPGGEPVFLAIPSQTVAGVGGGRSPDAPPVFNADPRSDVLINLLNNNRLGSLTAAQLTEALNAGGAVDSAIEALACMAADEADKIKSLVLVGSKNDRVYDSGEYLAAINDVFAFVIRMCGYPKKFQGGKDSKEMKNERKIASAVMSGFFEKIRPSMTGAQPDAKLALEIVQAARQEVLALNDRAVFATEAARLASSPAFASNAAPLAFELVKAQKAALVADYGEGEPQTQAQRQAALRDPVYQAARDATTSVEYFVGDFSVAPKEYLRSSLMSSPKLEAFIANTGFAWALPGDKASNYTTPNFRVAELRRSRIQSQQYIKQERGEPIALKSRLAAFQFHVNALQVKGGLSSLNMDGNRHNRHKKQHQSPSFGSSKPIATNVYNFGARPAAADDDEYDDYEEKKYSAKTTTTQRGATPAGYDPEIEQIVHRQHFYGPWASRMAVADRITDEFDRMNYCAILQTPNERDVHERLAALGVALIGLVGIRPFGRYRVSSAILMSTGEDVITKPIGHPDVDVSKNRDKFVVECSLDQGKVEVDGSKIHLMYGAFPEAYEGGKNTDLITNPGQYLTDDPSKAALTFMPVPLDEHKYGSETTHLLNRPLTRNGNRNRKVDPFVKNSFAPFYISVFTKEATDLAENLQHERLSYNKSCVVSHIAHPGPRTVFDPRTEQMVKINGFGPVNSFEMNSEECVDVFLQLETEFSSDRQSLAVSYRTK